MEGLDETAKTMKIGEMQMKVWKPLYKTTKMLKLLKLKRPFRKITSFVYFTIFDKLAKSAAPHCAGLSLTKIIEGPNEKWFKICKVCIYV